MKKILFYILIALCVSGNLDAATRWVAKTGSDSWDGLTPQTAWLTVDKLNQSMLGGDTAYFCTGTWYGTSLIPRVGGTSSDKTVYACSLMLPSMRGTAVINGGTVVSGWTVHSGSGASTIYMANWQPGAGYWNSGDGTKSYTISQFINGKDSLMTVKRNLGRVLRNGDAYHDNNTGIVYVMPYGGVNPSTTTFVASSHPVVAFGATRVTSGPLTWSVQNQDWNYFYYLDFRMGKGGTVVFGDATNPSHNNIQFYGCNITRASFMRAENPAVIFARGNITSPNDTANIGNIVRFVSFVQCSVAYASVQSSDPNEGPGLAATPEGHRGSLSIFYDATDVFFDSCAFHDAPGDGMESKNSYMSSMAQNITIKNSSFQRIGHAAFNIYRGARGDSLYGCTARNIGYALVTVSDNGGPNDYGDHFICNNSVYNYNAGCLNWPYYAAQSSIYRYNAFNDINPNTYLYDENDDGVPSVQGNSYNFRFAPTVTNLQWLADYNMWYDAATAFSAARNGTAYTLSGWQALGYELNSTTSNPLFNNSATGDFSRPASTQEINITYGGKNWTRIGAWQPSGSGCQTDTPVLSLPLNGSANLANPITFDWADVATATSYTLQVATDVNFSSIVLNVNPSVSTYVSSVFLDGVQYFWRVNATSACGVSAWASHRIFTMNCVNTPSITLVSPANNATNQPLSLSLDWADASGASNYQVQLSTLSNFTTTLYDQTPSVSTLSVSGLSYEVKYYWRVRGQNACGYGAWAADSFRTTNAPTGGSVTSAGQVTASLDDAHFMAGTYDNTGNPLRMGNLGPEVCSTYTVYTMGTSLTQGPDCDSAFAYFVSNGTYSDNTAIVRIRGELTGNSATLTAGTLAARTYTTAYVDWTFGGWTTGQVVKSPNLKTIIDEITNSNTVTRLGLRFSNLGSSSGAIRIGRSYDYSGLTDAPICSVFYPAPNIPPTVPVLTTPSASGSSSSLTPTLTLTNSTDGDGDAKTYLFQIATDSAFTNILVSSSSVAEGTTTTSWVSTVTLTNGFIYYWRARAFDGEAYSEWATPNKFIIATTRLVDIDQTWRNSTNGVINAANGFLTGDVVRMTSNIITPDNWGVIINTKGIVFQGDNYTIQCNDITVPAITNPGFETGTGTAADGWDFTHATNAQRLAGQYDEIAEYSNPSTLMSGSYSLRFQVPCTTQVVLSTNTYTLDANRNWSICAAYYNQIQNPATDAYTDSVRITIGFVSTAGDTLFSSEYLRGMMYRGPEPIVVHFKTSSITTGKIFFRLRNAQNIVSTNSFIWIDDVKILPFRPFSLGVAIDTTELKSLAQSAVRAYDAVGDSMYVVSGSSRMFSGLPTTSNVGDSTKIYNVVLRNNSAGGYGAYGLYYGYSADYIEVYNSNIYTIGPNAFNIVSGAAVYNKVYDNVLTLSVPYCDARESVPTSNIDFNGGKGPGPRGSIIYGNTFSGSIWCDINIQNRCDANIDGIDTYPVPIIRKNTFYRKTKITNGFVVDFTGSGGMVFDSNFVYASDTLHGSGVHVQYQSPSCEQWVVIRDNIIKVSPDTVNQEYPYGTLAYGIQLEEAPRCSVYTNYIFSITDNINDPSASSIRINYSGIPCNQQIFANVLVALSNNEANSPTACLQFGSPEGWDYDPIHGDTIEFFYNEFISNSSWIRSLPKLTNWQPNGNLFSISDSLATMSWFTPLASSTVDIGDPTDIRFLNNRYSDLASKTAFKNAYITSDVGSSSAEAGSQYFYAHQVIVNIASTNTGLFLPDIEVYAYRNDMTMQDVDFTTPYGKVYLLISEYEDAPLTSTYNAGTDRHNYNPYTIIARTVNQVLAETLVVTIDTATTINMNLDFNQYPVVSSAPLITINKPSNGKVIPPIFNADTLANVTVLDDFGIKSFNAYLRGGALNKNIYTTTNSVGNRPISQTFNISYDTQYEDTLAQYIVFVAEDDSSDIAMDSVQISIPIATNITVNFSGKYMKDTWVDANAPTVNRASSSSFRTTANGSRGWAYFDINALRGDSLPSIVDVVSAYIEGYCDTKTGTGNIGIYDVFKNGAMDSIITYNRYNTLNTLEWGLAGANNTGDYPTCNYNTDDATGCDRTASSLYSLAPVLSAYNRWDLPDSTIQFMFDNTKPNNGWLFVATSTLNATIQTLEGANTIRGSITYNVPRPAPVITSYNPVLAAIGNKSVTENQLLTFTVSASDQDLTTPFIFISEQTAPSGVVMTDNSNGTSLFEWTPTFRQAGVYNVLFIASDGQLTDSEMVSITVNDAGNQVPQLLFVSPQSVNENSALSFSIACWEPDSNSFILTATGLPSGASFIDNSDSTGTFSWTPNFVQSGIYNVSFIATETSGGTLADTEICVITVNNVNRSPVLASIGNKSVNEGVFLTFNLSATDADAQTLTFSALSLPAGASLSNISNGNAQINWLPSFAQSGVYNTTLIVSDGTAADSEEISITVSDVSGIVSITISGTTNIEDSYLRPSQPNANYSNYTGGSHAMYIFANATTGKGIIRFNNIATLLPVDAVITNAYIKFNVWQFTRIGTLNGHRVLQPWVEGNSNGGTTSGVSYNHFDITGTKLWTTAGCNSISDAGTDNTSGTVGTHFDRKATANGSIVITSTGFFNLPLQVSLVQGWRDGSMANNGVLLSTPDGDFSVYQTENATSTLRPELIIEYTTGASQAPKGRKNPLRGLNTGVIK